MNRNNVNLRLFVTTFNCLLFLASSLVCMVPETHKRKSEEITTNSTSSTMAAIPATKHACIPQNAPKISWLNRINWRHIQSLQQGDMWRCGYFTIFNVITMYNILMTQREQQVNLENLKLNTEDCAIEFENFYSEIFQANPQETFSQFYQVREGLHLEDGKNLLSMVFGKDIKQIPNLFLAVEFVLRNRDEKRKTIYLLTDQATIEKTIPTDFQKPIIIILKTLSHWSCHIFTKTAIFSLDSYIRHGTTYEENCKATSHVTHPTKCDCPYIILKDLYRYFSGTPSKKRTVLCLPSTEEIRSHFIPKFPFPI